MSAFSTKQSRGQKVRSAVQSNVSGSSIDKDIHHESTRQREVMKYLREVMKYLRESCYHRIKCSTINSLTALMWK